MCSGSGASMHHALASMFQLRLQEQCDVAMNKLRARALRVTVRRFQMIKRELCTRGETCARAAGRTPSDRNPSPGPAWSLNISCVHAYFSARMPILLLLLHRFLLPLLLPLWRSSLEVSYRWRSTCLGRSQRTHSDCRRRPCTSLCRYPVIRARTPGCP